MPDVERDLSTLLSAHFQDGQADGSITAQDVRDLLVSLRTARGSLTLTDNATETVIAATNTFVTCAGTFSLGGQPVSMTEGASGRLTYTGASSRYFVIYAAFSLTAASNNQVLEFSIAKNGTPIGGQIHRKVSTGVDVGAAAVVAAVELATNDYVELHVANNTSTANVTVTQASITTIGVL